MNFPLSDYPVLNDLLQDLAVLTQISGISGPVLAATERVAVGNDRAQWNPEEGSLGSGLRNPCQRRVAERCLVRL